MKIGDLVRPLVSCGGNPGAMRCNLALVIETNSFRHATDPEYIKVWCPCGTTSDYSHHFEKMEGEPEITYAADPM